MDATAYRQFSIKQNRGEMALFERLGCTGTGALLDIGCGDGRITGQMADALPQWTLTGLDPNAELLALAEESCQQSNLAFTRRTLADLPADQTFDVITIFNALHLIPNNEAFLADVRRRLNPGGQLLILTHPLDSPTSQILRETLLSPEWATNVNHETITARRFLAEYDRTLATLNFETVHRETYQSKRYVDSPAQLTEMMAMALPFFGSFSPPELKRCAEAITLALGDTPFNLLTLAYIGRA